MLEADLLFYELTTYCLNALMLIYANIACFVYRGIKPAIFYINNIPDKFSFQLRKQTWPINIGNLTDCCHCYAELSLRVSNPFLLFYFSVLQVQLNKHTT